VSMLRYELVSPQMIVSRTASRLYRASAIISIGRFVSWITFSEGLSQSVFAPTIVLVAAISAAITIVGMEFFLFRFDESRFLKQIFWFVAMLVPLLGASLYCFLVYSRSEVVRSGFQEKPIVTLGT